MAWAPNTEGLTQIVNLLQNTASPDTAVQAQVSQQLEQFKNNIPDFNNYLSHILSRRQDLSEHVRQVAGLILKNNVKPQNSLTYQNADNLNAIKQDMFNALQDPISKVRNTGSTVLTTMMGNLTFANWPDCLPTLAQCLQSDNQHLIEGAFVTMLYIFEDAGHNLAAIDESILAVVIPRAISFFASPSSTFRRLSVSVVSQFILMMPQALVASMDAFLTGLFTLTQDTTPDVRKKVCQALVLILETKASFLEAHLNDIITFFMGATEEKDESVALEATEFWSAFCESPAVDRAALLPFLPRLVPVLVRNMVYGEDELAMLPQDDDFAVPDSAEDIKPRFHNAKSIGGVSNAVRGEDSDEDDFDDDDGGEVDNWTLRKCSAAGLDMISTTFGQQLLPILLPILHQNLTGTEWEIRESSILALGAIAEGCHDDLAAHLPQLVPYMIQLLNDPKPLIRSITCWTLSRFSHWIVENAQHFDPVMKGLLTRIVDNNKKVQEAACSALATLEEAAPVDKLTPLLPFILQHLVEAFGKYQAKNLMMLYDTVATLADVAGQTLNKPEYIAMLMQPLSQKWMLIANDDRNLFGVLECLTAVAMAVGEGFASYAPDIFNRGIVIIDKVLTEMQQYAAAPDTSPLPDKEFLVLSLDLISGLCEGLRESVEHLVGQSNLCKYLTLCLKEHAFDVRQSAFALVGDLAKTCMVHIKPHLGEILPHLLQEIYPEHHSVSVCNNSIWALGEIANRVGPELGEPCINQAIQRLGPLLGNQKMHSSLLENTSITVGRLALVAPQTIAQAMGGFLDNWLRALSKIRADEDGERRDAFKGLCACVKANPTVAMEHLPLLVFTILSSYPYPDDELRGLFKPILEAIKNHLGANWGPFLNTFPEEYRPVIMPVLQESYGLM